MKFIFLPVLHRGYSFYNNINRIYAELRQSLLHLPANSFLNGQRLFVSPFLQVQFEMILKRLKLSF